jgi:hypothetical protein
MAVTEWHPDTCDCVIVQDNATGAWVATVAKCKLHIGLDGQSHLDTVNAHHRQFNDLSKYSSNKSDQAKDKENLGLDETGDPILGDTPKQKHLKHQAVLAKVAEKERIRKL